VRKGKRSSQSEEPTSSREKGEGRGPFERDVKVKKKADSKKGGGSPKRISPRRGWNSRAAASD